MEDAKNVQPLTDETKKEKDLIGAACRAYGIAKQYVIGSRIDGNEAIVVTMGGKKVRFKEGDKPEALSAAAITGGIPKKGKPITGGKK